MRLPIIVPAGWGKPLGGSSSSSVARNGGGYYERDLRALSANRRMHRANLELPKYLDNIASTCCSPSVHCLRKILFPVIHHHLVTNNHRPTRIRVCIILCIPDYQTIGW